MRKVFLNVVILAVMLAIGAGFVMGILRSIGAASIVVPVGASITVGFLTIATLLARRNAAPSSGGRVTKVSINALALFVAAWIVFPVSLEMGGEAFMESIRSGVDSDSVALKMLLGQVGPVAASAVGVLMAFAGADQGDDPE